MSYGGFPYGSVAYGGSDVALIPQSDTQTTLAVEVAFTTNPLAEPAWVDITPDVRSWSTSRGRRRELERFQPGRATIVLANRERQYDSVYDAGPWFGNLKPMKRIRIRETFNGVTYPVFDGFVDKWQLDYPNVNRDATATVTATDAFKLFARTDLGRSVYDNEVGDDAPEIWWRLDETKNSKRDASLLALNAGTVGPTGDATYIGPPTLGSEPLIVNDPGGSIALANSDAVAHAPLMGTHLDDAAFDLVNGGTGSFVVEVWCRPIRRDASDQWVWSWSNEAAQLIFEADESFYFSVTGATSGQVTADPAGSSAPLMARYHVVARYVNNEPLKLWVNGTLTTGGTPVGAVANTNPFRVGHISVSNFWNFTGDISQVAIWRGAAAEAVDTAWVLDHYTAGTNPWNGDFPSGRIRRALELVGWPDGPLYLPGDWVQLDDGQTSFQSATIDGQTALEHIQKAAESEYGALVFIDRGGRVRFRDRTSVLAREPYPVTFGMEAGKIGYRSFVPDDGDDTIRNRATISRLDGVARTSEDSASIADFGVFQQTFDGLLMDSDDTSGEYADFIVSEYKDQRRRIVELWFGPPVTGEESLAYPAMLGLELGDSIEVENLPLGGGDLFSQTCVIEGIEHEGRPGGDRSCRLMLSPELLANTAEELLLTESSDELQTETGLDLEVE